MKSKIQKVDIFDENEFEIWCKKLKVEKISSAYHSLIEEYCQKRRDRSIRKKEKYIHGLPISTQWNNNLKTTVGKDDKPVLFIQISDVLLKRACLFLNYLFCVIQAIEGTIRVRTDRGDNITIEWPYAKVEIQLIEMQVKQRDVKEKTKSMRPSYEKIYTGKFMLQLLLIDSKERQQDKLVFQDNDCTIEEQIGDIVCNLGKILREKKVIYTEEEKNRRQKELEERIRLVEKEKLREKVQQEEKKAEDIEKQKSAIYQQMLKYQKIKQIDEYVNSLRREHIEDQATKKEIECYCKFIENLFRKDDFLDEVKAFMKNTRVDL